MGQTLAKLTIGGKVLGVLGVIPTMSGTFFIPTTPILLPEESQLAWEDYWNWGPIMLGPDISMVLSPM